MLTIYCKLQYTNKWVLGRRRERVNLTTRIHFIVYEIFNFCLCYDDIKLQILYRGVNTVVKQYHYSD